MFPCVAFGHHISAVTEINTTTTQHQNTMKANIKSIKTSPKSTKTPAEPTVTPQASLSLFESLKPAFSDTTKSWLVGAKSGALVFAARIADVRVIAACLLSKMDALPVGADGGVDKDSIKIVRTSFNKLSPENKAKWEAEALPLFKSALKDYHSATAPLKKLVFSSSKFAIRSLRVGVAKKTGNVSVTSRHLALGSDLL